jgi:hypothetical protein
MADEEGAVRTVTRFACAGWPAIREVLNHGVGLRVAGVAHGETFGQVQAAGEVLPLHAETDPPDARLRSQRGDGPQQVRPKPLPRQAAATPIPSSVWRGQPAM